MSEKYLSFGQNTLNSCNCCQGKSEDTPASIDNRPGLSAIAYRIGSHARFKQSMQAKLSGSTYPALSGLTTRQNSDFSIALVDAWATVCDVLTFYQERIANESYLKTATERFSVRELGRLVGYTLSPGVAASTCLAFTVDEPAQLPESVTEYYPTLEDNSSQGYQTPDRIIVAVGTKVQSVPGQDELPQTFETILEIEARVEWNALTPRLAQPQEVNFSTTTLYIKGTGLNLQVGGRILIIQGSKAEHRIITEVKSDTTRNRTVIALKNEGTPERRQRLAPTATTQMQTKKITASMGTTLSTDAESETLNVEVSLSKAAVNELILNRFWEEQELHEFMERNGWAARDLIRVVQKILKESATANSAEVHLLQEQVGFFGNNAPHHAALIGAGGTCHYCDYEEWTIRDLPPLPDSPATPSPLGQYDEDFVYLERTIQGILPESWVLLCTPEGMPELFKIEKINEKSLVGFGMSARATGLSLKTVDDAPLPASLNTQFKVRTTTAYLKSKQLELTDMPVSTETLAKRETALTLGRMVCGLKRGQLVALQGELAEQPGVTGGEILCIEKIHHEKGYTTLTFKEGVAAAYVYATITLNANVAAATHGETVMEVLGSGDGSTINQSFQLRQPPLTYISGSTASGRESTLQVRVNDLLWEEVEDFFGRGPDDHIYVTKQNEDGTTSVHFGDGKTGARLPTGQENVRAHYRTGIGTGGNVKAGQLSQLMSRPLGLKEVINPEEARGGDDSEPLARARQNTPLHVLTLDRIVSFKDYENFARSFAGIAKAQASLSCGSTEQMIIITVSGPEGAEIFPDQATYKNLMQAMQDAGDPHVQLRLTSYRKAFFRIAGTVWSNPEYEPDKVQAALSLALRSQFGFAARELTQPVRLSEIISAIHAVPGVTAVDVDCLHRTNKTPALQQHLEAETARSTANGHINAAELLLLDTTCLSALHVVARGTQAPFTRGRHLFSPSFQMPKIRYSP
ncbi:putative baseplate assembly protein [Desulfogranum japonicum]|uniref:putative baseplate assembly protein n=1 Tax=Desulfogranum japonicum TaxID=231447 RepID=UPI00048FD95C|nr:putative baseplate assembly protein [Desulfogranum japonicum]